MGLALVQFQARQCLNPPFQGSTSTCTLHRRANGRVLDQGQGAPMDLSQYFLLPMFTVVLPTRILWPMMARSRSLGTGLLLDSVLVNRAAVVHVQCGSPTYTYIRSAFVAGRDQF
jgi:hypothetical protein